VGEIHEAYPNAAHIGLTATPERLDGKGLGKYFKRSSSARRSPG
jgi:superfamily II DNA or RNA helicase